MLDGYAISCGYLIAINEIHPSTSATKMRKKNERKNNNNKNSNLHALMFTEFCHRPRGLAQRKNVCGCCWFFPRKCVNQKSLSSRMKLLCSLFVGSFVVFYFFSSVSNGRSVRTRIKINHEKVIRV